MGYFDEENVTFDEETVAQYLNIIGLDESEVKESKIKKVKAMKLYSLSDLYGIVKADRLLLDSSKVVGSDFELLISQLNDEFLYTTEEEKEHVTSEAYRLLNELSCIQVSDDTENAYEIFERTNKLIDAVLTGIICTENIPHLGMVYDNLSPSLIYSYGKNEENKNVKRLYNLMALSKFENSEIDYEIFNEFDEIDDKKLDEVLETLIREKEASLEPTEVEACEQESKTLKFRRPSFKKLKGIEDYRRL